MILFLFVRVTRFVILRQVARCVVRDLPLLSFLLALGGLGDNTARMVVIPGVRLLVHDELESLINGHLTDLVRYIG